jgi:hypothetical protein
VLGCKKSQSVTVGDFLNSHTTGTTLLPLGYRNKFLELQLVLGNACSHILRFQGASSAQHHIVTRIYLFEIFGSGELKFWASASSEPVNLGLNSSQPSAVIPRVHPVVIVQYWHCSCETMDI